MSQQGIRPSLSLLHQGHEQLCRIGGGAGGQAELVSIGGGGLVMDGQPIGPLSSHVAWKNGHESGGESNAHPGIGIRLLQQATGVGPQGRKGAA